MVWTLQQTEVNDSFFSRVRNWISKPPWCLAWDILPRNDITLEVQKGCSLGSSINLSLEIHPNICYNLPRSQTTNPRHPNTYSIEKVCMNPQTSTEARLLTVPFTPILTFGMTGGCWMSRLDCSLLLCGNRAQSIRRLLEKKPRNFA